MITFNVTQADINNADMGHELTHCVVANAVRREFKAEEISCGETTLTFDGKDFQIDPTTSKKIRAWTLGKKIRPFVAKIERFR